MAEPTTGIERPQRWDVPFGPDMTDDDVDRILSVPPFSEIDPSQFREPMSLRGIIGNDCRLIRGQVGDIILREGDYGSSLFHIISGRVRVAIEALPAHLLGRADVKRKGLLASVAQLWTNSRTPEFRDPRKRADHARRGEGAETRVFLPDVPVILDKFGGRSLEAGEFFGELGALGRIPRSATVFAETEFELLELRWQGFRDLRKRAAGIREHIDRIYRERALVTQLRNTFLFKHLGDAELDEIADHVTFETFGAFDWYGSYKKLTEQDPAQRLAHEPVIAREGHHTDSLILIRAGFARVSRKFGAGEQTVSYLGAGQGYGFDELREAWKTGRPVPLQRTIRAVGYVDVIRVPAPIFEEYVLARGAALPQTDELVRDSASAEPASSSVDPALLEFFVENRYMNGSATMLIDLDRCTGCDDCVRACADAHDGNPRFIRHGRQHGHHMLANACMHCADPVCMIGCPTGAIHREGVGQQVVINDQTCIGCATCANSCPYQNIRMVDIRDGEGEFIVDRDGRAIQKATKCDLCSDQLGGPACQRACPHDALIRMDMADTAKLSGYLDR